jgi:hypothetical protein
MNGMRLFNAKRPKFELSHRYCGQRKRSKDRLQQLDSWEQPQAFGVVIFGDVNVWRVIVLGRQENVFSTTVSTIASIPKRCLPHNALLSEECGAEPGLSGNGDRVIVGR